MNKRFIILAMLMSSLFGGGVVLTGFLLFGNANNYTSFGEKQNVIFTPTHYSPDTAYHVPAGLNFIDAAENVRRAVVHIKTSGSGMTASKGEDEMNEMFRDFHGFPFHKGPKESAGSGVIISSDGYIATNNHVIEDADRIEVVLDDKRSFAGTIIGTDPTTDLALIKIEQSNLPFVKYGNSDKVHIGEWVLAVGNPFDLTSTVTAGIVSAKGRDINILKDNAAIESFIQTDAAVNPGNSGGALVNLKGQLIGINTAIATNTGFYAGYSFAIPVNLAKKVMDDLLRYGLVQRGLLGVAIREVDAQLAEEMGLKDIKGVFVKEVNENSAAHLAGIQSGDVITFINGMVVNSASELQSVVGTYHPGDIVKVTFERNGNVKTASVTLKNKSGDTVIVKKESGKSVTIMGAELQPISDKDKERLGVEMGVKIVKLSSGKIKDVALREGFIITHLDHKAVSSPGEVARIIQQAHSALLIEGIYPDGTKDYRAIAP
jgi:Do/DeqQ family serine protease